MVIKKQFSREDLAGILADYKTGDFRDARLLLEDERHTVILIETDEQRYVFKHYRNRLAPSVHFEANLLNHLRRKKFPCVHPVQRLDTSYFGMFEDHPYVLFHYVEGEVIENPLPIQWSQIIKTAASLQRITRIYTPQNRKDRENYSVAYCLDQVEQIARGVDTKEVREISGWYERELATINLRKTIPKGICHCDYRPGNILFEGNRIVALIDFDEANFTFLAYDLIVLMNMKAREGHYGYNFRLARDVLEEYVYTRKPGTREKNALFDLHRLNILIEGLKDIPHCTLENLVAYHRVNHFNEIGQEAYMKALFGELR